MYVSRTNLDSVSFLNCTAFPPQNCHPLVPPSTHITPIAMISWHVWLTRLWGPGGQELLIYFMPLSPVTMPAIASIHWTQRTAVEVLPIFIQKHFKLSTQSNSGLLFIHSSLAIKNSLYSFLKTGKKKSLNHPENLWVSPQTNTLYLKSSVDIKM